jgi:hypothetical protein
MRKICKLQWSIRIAWKWGCISIIASIIYGNQFCAMVILHQSLYDPWT